MVGRAVREFLNGADYTFTIFSGHGFLNLDENSRQYLEVADTDISILKLRTTAKRQTLIIDACRGFYIPTQEFLKGFSELYEHFTGDIYSTRQLYDKAILTANEGWTILYAARRNQTALDTNNGGAYLLSLLRIAENWEASDIENNIIDLKVAHEFAKEYLADNFDTIQIPIMNGEKRLEYFPFAVKVTSIQG